MGDTGRNSTHYYAAEHGCSWTWSLIFASAVLSYFVINIWAYQHLLKKECLNEPIPDESWMFALSFAYVPDTFFAVGSGLAQIDVESNWVVLNIINSLAGGLMILGIIAGGFSNFSDFFEMRFGIATPIGLSFIYFPWIFGCIPAYCCFVNHATYQQSIYYAFTLGFTSGMTVIDEYDKKHEVCSKQNLIVHGIFTYISVIVSTCWASSVGGKFFEAASARLFPVLMPEEKQKLMP